jgi:hypothetical protein
LVFLNLDSLNVFLNYLRKKKPKHKFILISHNSDKSFTDCYYEKLKSYVTKIYAINNTALNANVISIPIGFRDYPASTLPLLKSSDSLASKTMLVYMNFCINTNIKKRTECFDSFKDKDWVTKKQRLSVSNFYSDIASAKYLLSPEGTGIDCHRVYESMYFNAIAIIKTSCLDNFFMHLPVLLVNNWSEVTEEFLVSKYDNLLERLLHWKQQNPLWTSPQFWISRQNASAVI